MPLPSHPFTFIHHLWLFVQLQKETVLSEGLLFHDTMRIQDQNPVSSLARNLDNWILIMLQTMIFHFKTLFCILFESKDSGSILQLTINTWWLVHTIYLTRTLKCSGFFFLHYLMIDWFSPLFVHLWLNHKWILLLCLWL